MINIKNLVKWTYFYQLRRSNKYFKSIENRIDLLNPDEKPSARRFVRNHNDKSKQIVDMLNKINITIRPNCRFQTWLDTGLYVVCLNNITDNIPPQYTSILNNSLLYLIQKYQNVDNMFHIRQYEVLNEIKKYIERIIVSINENIEKNPKDKYLKKTKEHFENMISAPAKTVEDALQRILFWSSMFWQSQHLLVGIGRLDKLLGNLPYEDNDHKAVLIDFYNEMHRYYAIKSGPTSLGDTGQIIIIGGLEPDGNYFCNEFTYDIIRTMKLSKLPDPKVLLRVSFCMPEDLLYLSLECIQTGIGCPLLANDDVIIPALIDFGYEREDAYNYVTSACWEPLVYGKSLEKNNVNIINYATSLTNIICDEKFVNYTSFNQLFNAYTNELKMYLDLLLADLSEFKWEEDPLTSLLTSDCFEMGKDISQGGAKYNDYGILSVGMTNVINSLFNIKKLVFEEGDYTLEEIKKIIIKNYDGYEKDRKVLKQKGYYGSDDEKVLAVVNKIIDVTKAKCSGFKNYLGGKVKFGLSTSNYVETSIGTIATPDGRKNGEPLRAHITSTGDGTYTELVNFASQLDYSGYSSNGNVVDFFVSPSFLNDNFDKFLLFIKEAVKKGFFEMQINVVSSETLINAKKNPDKYPNLIVRIWGFSAYFKDLPQDYQNVLIERALQSEGRA